MSVPVPLCIAFVLLGTFSTILAQQRGQIIKQGDNVLDPLQDGWVTTTGGAFSNDGYYVDEFEFTMFGLPISGDGEALNDIQNGPDCGTTDLSQDINGFTAYGVLDDFGNLIFRFRLGGDRPSIEGYTVLIDIDGKLGDDDPNATASNPGFEIDITLIENKGVRVYDLDGQDSCPSFLYEYDLDTHYQRSVAGTESCDDPDYFLDFYVPFSDLVDAFGVSLQTEMRFFAVTNISATCAMGGSISDIGGVDDNDFSGCNVCAFQELSDSQCPTTLEDLCSECAGFSSGSTPKPSINAPVKVGETSLSGTSEPDANIFIDVYNELKTLVDQDTTRASMAGDWSSILDVSLQQLDSITARAQLDGGCTSGVSESDVSFAVVIVNTAPQLAGTGSALTYNENNGNVSVDNGITISDPDDLDIESATVRFTQNYTPAEDLLAFTDQSGISGSYDAVSGILNLSGTATLGEYQVALRSITYSNSSENPITATRTISFVINDGLDDSNIVTRGISVVSINDIPTVTGTTTPHLYKNGDGAVTVLENMVINDLDHLNLSSATVSISNNFLTGEDVLAFVDQNGITGSYDGATGILPLTGSSSIANYVTALESITYEKTGAVSGLTRRLSVVVSDGLDPSITFNRDIDIDGSNAAPVIVENGNPVDFIFASTDEDTPITICVEANDPDGDMVQIESTSLADGLGTISLSPTDPLCFEYTPNEDVNGVENITVDVCDQTVDQLCDQVVVVLTINPVNDPPIITEAGLPADTIRITTAEDTAIQHCITGNDPDNDGFTVVSGNSITGNGSFDIGDPDDLCYDFIPNADFSGQEIGNITVCDDQTPALCDDVIVVVDITPVNDPPVIINNSSKGNTPPMVPTDTLFFETKEDFTLGICIELTDPDFGPWKIESALSVNGVGSNTLSIVNSQCYTFKPLPNINGTDITEVIICDNGNPVLCDTVVVSTTVVPVNDPPVIMAESDTLFLETDEDVPFNFCLDVTDIENDALTITETTSMTNNGISTPTVGGSVCIDFNPTLNFFGQEIANYTVCDDGSPSQCDEVIAAITVHPVNDAPLVVEDEYVVLRNRSISANILENDSDTEDHNLLVRLPLESMPLRGMLEISEAGDFTYTPDKAFFGEDSFSYIICDDGDPSACTTGTTRIIVENIDLLVYQGVSPNGDGNNDFWRIEGIDLFENNLVRLYDRFNNIVFELAGYNNTDRVWQGESNRGVSGKDLPEGTYYYVINLGDGDSLISGFIVLKRN